MQPQSIEIMDTNRKEWVDTRRKTVEDYYDLPPAEKERLENILHRMEELAESCETQGDFEQKMLTSPLNTEYMQFFSGIGSYIKQDRKAEGSEGLSKKEMAKEMAVSAAKTQARGFFTSWLVNILPDRYSRFMIERQYAIPILGPVLRAIDSIENFNWIFGKKGKV